MEETYILGIETSCDETAASVVVNGRTIMSNEIYSQIDLHRLYGGVVPEIASRKHIESISIIVEEALNRADITFDQIDALAVTCGPGLVGSLLVGLSYAKGLSWVLNKPLIGVNHIEGHICANYLENPDFAPPFLCLVVSGGHTHLVHISDYGRYSILGRTRDDAAGEAYDKAARAMGLNYPGGPEIDRLSLEGNDKAVDFPRAWISEDSLDFSFSGLKSAVLNYLNTEKMHGREICTADVAASFQAAVIDVLVGKTMAAAELLQVRKIALAGGVSCNQGLRKRMRDACSAKGYMLQIPAPVFCTDNAAMIASCGYYQLQRGRPHDLKLNAVPGLSL